MVRYCGLVSSTGEPVRSPSFDGLRKNSLHWTNADGCLGTHDVDAQARGISRDVHRPANWRSMLPKAPSCHSARSWHVVLLTCTYTIVLKMAQDRGGHVNRRISSSEQCPTALTSRVQEPSRGNKRKKTQDALYEAGDLHQDASGHGAARDNHSDALSWHTSFEGCPPQGYQDARSAFAAPSSSQLRFQAIAGSQPSGVVAVDHHADPGHGFSLSANGYFSSGSGTVLYNEPVQLGAASISAPDQRVVPFGAFNSAIHDQNTVAQYDSSVFGNIAFDSTSSRGREQHVLMGETQYVPAEPAAEYAQYPNYAMHISGPVYPQQMASATGTVCPGVVVSQKDQGQDGRKQSQSLVAKIATDFVHADDNSTTTNDKKQPVKRTALTVSPKRKKGDTPKVKTCLRCRVQKIRVSRLPRITLADSIVRRRRQQRRMPAVPRLLQSQQEDYPPHRLLPRQAP